jgi:glycine dehydrogenase
MASSCPALRTHLGRLTTQTRSSVARRSSQLTGPWICRQSPRTALGTTSIARRTFYTSSASDEAIRSPTAEVSRGAYLPLDTFARRHIGPSADTTEQMLKALDPPVKSLDEFVKQVLPSDILNRSRN